MVQYKRAVIFSSILIIFLLGGCSSISASASHQETALAATQPSTASVSVPTLSLTPPPPVETETPLPTFTQTPVPPTPTQTSTPTLTATSTETPTATPDTRLKADQWRSWPIVPTLSARALAIYQEGQKMGNDSHVFSRVGDCQSESAIMMGVYDTPRRYKLNPGFEYLQTTIDQFKGSFSRANITVRRGFGIASVFNPLLSDRQKCNSDETPLACEYRLNKPVIAIISMGTNWCAGCTNKFEEYLRKIVDYSIQQGVIPIISTKADNIEKDWSINEAMARVAYEYDIPLWNFWAAVQYLPNHGLMPDDTYLTVPGWNERGFTGLQTLDAIWTAIQAAAESN